jgi:hypothetical protein
LSVIFAFVYKTIRIQQEMTHVYQSMKALVARCH